MKYSPSYFQFETASRFLATLFLCFAVLLAGLLVAPSTAGANDGAASGLSVLKPTRVGATKKVELGLDKSLVVELPRDVRDVLVANPEIADAIVRTARKIFLIGNQIGQTNVFMFDKAGNTVLSLDLKVERDIGPLDKLIEKYVPGSDVTVEIVNDNVVLTGTVPNPLAASRAADLANVFLTGGEATTGQFTQSATTGGLAGASTSVISNPDSERATSQVVNLLQIEGEDQVHLKVVIAEVRRSVLKQLGIDFSVAGTNAGAFRRAVFGAAGFSQVGGVAAVLSRTANNGNTLEGTIDALERANVLKTLAEPTLTAQSGREASFLAGGVVFIPISSDIDDDDQINITNEQVELGVSLSFVPVVQSPERISLTINTEVSDIDTTRSLATVGPTSLPAIATRRASSTIELPSGGTMILGGLIRDDIRQASSGIPYLKNVPVLGPLFGSNNFIRNETELVIMVTPYLVRPTARKNLTQPDKNYALNNDVGNFLFNRLNRIYGGKNGGTKGRYHGRVGFIYD